MDIQQFEQCPECGSANVIHNEKKQHIICRECGNIFTELMPDQMRKFRQVSGVLP